MVFARRHTEFKLHSISSFLFGSVEFVVVVVFFLFLAVFSFRCPSIYVVGGAARVVDVGCYGLVLCIQLYIGLL